jgi:hypothetical protein
VLLLCGCFVSMFQLNAKAESPVVNLSLTFHNYSIILKDSNGSFCVYNGADGSTASVNPTQTNLVSEISGQQVVYGMSVSYWSAVIIWAIKLPMDLHVDGTVNLKAFISSNFPISGFFSGGGYGMGLVDIDENNNEVQEFITQPSYSQGSNPFTASPTQYSVSTNVDYTFKAGHSIGYAVGIGATAQGFTANVYFDSATYNSGVTLPVEDTMKSNSFSVNYNGAEQNLAVTSDSAISNFQFNSGSNSIQFDTQGISYTTGQYYVSIPKTLMQSPFKVTSGTQQITASVTENSSYSQLSFSHAISSSPIQITGALSTVSPTTSATASPAVPTPSSSTSDATATNPSTSPSETSSPELPVYLAIAIFAILTAMVSFAVLFKKMLMKKRKSF